MMCKRALVVAVVSVVLMTVSAASLAAPVSFCEKHRAYAESVMASRQIGLNKSVLERSVLKALAGANDNPGMALFLTATINRAYAVPFQEQQAAKQTATQRFASAEYQRCQMAMAAADRSVR